MNRAKTRLWELCYKESYFCTICAMPIIFGIDFFVSFLVNPAVLFFLVAAP